MQPCCYGTTPVAIGSQRSAEEQWVCWLHTQWVEVNWLWSSCRADHIHTPAPWAITWTLQRMWVWHAAIAVSCTCMQLQHHECSFNLIAWDCDNCSITWSIAQWNLSHEGTLNLGIRQFVVCTLPLCVQNLKCYFKDILPILHVHATSKRLCMSVCHTYRTPKTLTAKIQNLCLLLFSCGWTGAAASKAVFAGSVFRVVGQSHWTESLRGKQSH